jgi:tmRNA-binding protein
MLIFSLNSPLHVERFFCENIEVEVFKTFIIIAHYNLNNFTTNKSIYHRKLLLKIMKIKIIIKKLNNELIFEK